MRLEKTYNKDLTVQINKPVCFGWQHPQNKSGEPTNVGCMQKHANDKTLSVLYTYDDIVPSPCRKAREGVTTRVNGLNESKSMKPVH